MDKEAKRDLLITGCPRSGTLYTAKLLRSKGWRIGWETLATSGMVSWMAAVDSQEVPFGTGSADVEFENCFGIVRDPMRSCWSIRGVCMESKSRDNFLEFVRRFITLEDNDNLLEMAIDFYSQWMDLVQKKASAIFRVEDDPSLLLTACWDVLPLCGPPLEKHPSERTHAVHADGCPNELDMGDMVSTYHWKLLQEKRMEFGYGSSLRYSVH